MKLVKFFNFVIFPLTLVLGLLLLLSGQVAAISPKFNTYLALVGLAFPLLFLVNFLLLIYWLIQLKWKMLFPIAFLMLNMGQMGLYIRFGNTPDFPSRPEDLIKVVNYNAHLFGAFSNVWEQDSVIQVLQSEKADIICLQEVYAKNETMASLLKRFKSSLNFNYGLVYKLRENRPYGMLILSKFPIKQWKPISLGPNTGNMAMWIDIAFKEYATLNSHGDKLKSPIMSNQRTVRLFNIHLQSFRFNKEDYKAIEDAKNNQLDEQKSRGLIYRMRLAYEKRAEQVEKIKSELQECKLPKIVLGDFNDVPVSYTYREISEGLNDAFVASGSGLETTYKGPFPSFRIDYILFSDPFKCESYKSRKNVPGDHKLITAKLKFDELFY